MKQNIPTLWNIMKTIFKGKLIAMNIYIRKPKISETGNSEMHLKNMGKKAQEKLRIGRTNK